MISFSDENLSRVWALGILSTCVNNDSVVYELETLADSVLKHSFLVLYPSSC